MKHDDYIGKTFLKKIAPYKGKQCKILKIDVRPYDTNIEVEIDVGEKKIIESFLRPEDLGLDIKWEIPECPENIADIFIENIHKDPKVKKVFNIGASSEELDSVKSELNLELPDNFFKFYENFNGTIYSNMDDARNVEYTLYKNSAAFLKLKDILKVKKYWDDKVKHLRNNFDPKDAKNKLHWYWNENFVPYLITNQVLLVIDTTGVKTKNKFQIMSFGRIGAHSLSISHESLDKYFQTDNSRLERKVLLSEGKYDNSIYSEINGLKISQIEIFPFDILPDLDWSNIFHM